MACLDSKTPEQTHTLLFDKFITFTLKFWLKWDPACEKCNYGSGLMVFQFFWTKLTQSELLDPRLLGEHIFWLSVNKIFPSTVCPKTESISHHQKLQNKNFSVIGKYHISINFLAQKRLYFPFYCLDGPGTTLHR